MTDRDDDSTDIEAAEYVLGTLRGERCERFEVLMRTDPDVARRVREWEARLAPMIDAYETTGSSEVPWAAIEQRLFASEASPATAHSAPRVSFWQRTAAACAALAAACVAFALYFATGVDRPQCYAVLGDALGLPVAVVFDRRNMQELVVLPVGSRLAQGEGTPTLWIAAGSTTRRVGVLNADGETRLALDKPLLTAVMDSSARLIVSREAAGTAQHGPVGVRVADGAIALLGTAAAPSKAL